MPRVTLVLILHALGLAVSAYLPAYNAPPPMAACLTAFSSLLAAVFCWLGLACLQVSVGPRLLASLSVPLIWNTLMLSQFPYYGFGFIPVEILLAARMLRRRFVPSASWFAVLAVAAPVRLVSLASAYAVKPLIKPFFPWQP